MKQKAFAGFLFKSAFLVWFVYAMVPEALWIKERVTILAGMIVLVAGQYFVYTGQHTRLATAWLLKLGLVQWSKDIQAVVEICLFILLLNGLFLSYVILAIFLGALR